MEQIGHKTRKITLMGLLLAMTLILSFIESTLPPLPPPFPPTVRFGLSNIIVMYTLFFLGGKSGFIMVAMKALFIVLQRGVAAAFTSLFGGLFSVSIMLLMLLIFRVNISYLSLSVLGALFHNIGQLVAGSLQVKTNILLPMLPLILVGGAVMGVATSVLLRVIMPAFVRFNPQLGEDNSVR